ncbi:uncharacterized protein LOC144175259 [Haemaphysalis longicornis]
MSSEESTEQNDSSSEVEVSSRLQYSKILPLRCHIFMMYGSFAAVLPTTSVEAEQLGIKHPLVGAMMAVVPFSTVLAVASLPYFRSHAPTIKRVMILAVLGQSTCHLLALWVTRGHRRAFLDVAMRLQCPLADNASTSPLTACLESPLSRHPKLCPSHNDTKTADTDDAHVLTCALKCACFCDHDPHGTANASASHCLVSDERNLGCGDDYCVSVAKASHLAVLCDEETTPPCRLRCHEIALLPEEVPPVSEFAHGLASLRQGVVWGFLALRLLAIVFSGVAITLTDAAIDLVEDEPPPSRWTDMHRLLGSAGWGAASLLTGHLNYWKSPDGGAFINFAPGVYLSVSMNAVDVVAIMLLQMPLRETPTGRLFTSEPSVFLKSRTQFYMALSYVMGSLSGAIWVFGPLRLRLLGAAPQLLGATSAVQVFGGELVHAFTSDQLVQLLGVRNAASASVLGMVARLLVYAFTPVPWALLPVEAAQGLTVGLFSKTTFSLATGATPDWHLQQVLSTIHHGLGASFGALVAGCLIPLLQLDGIFVFYAAVAVLTFYAQLAFGYIRAKKDAASRRRRIIVKFARGSPRRQSAVS